MAKSSALIASLHTQEDGIVDHMRNDPLSIEKSRELWKLKSKKYPSAFDPDTLQKTMKIIRMVRDHGFRISDTRVLDIGCGTGIFTLPLAKEAQQATGVDFSEDMLARLEATASENAIKNVSTICLSWHDADLKDLGFIKAFDSAWASMTMAVQSIADLEKMQNCARDFCVYVGWGRKRENRLKRQIFRSHGLELKPSDSAGRTLKNLELMGVKPKLQYFDALWRWQGSIDEAVDEMSAHVAAQGAEPDLVLIKKILSEYAPDGIVEHTTEVEQGLIIWQPE